MPRERIVTCLQGRDTDADHAYAAAKLARSLDAGLDAIFVEPDPSNYLLWTGPGAAMAAALTTTMETVRAESERAAEAAKQVFIAALERAGLPAAQGRFMRVAESPADAATELRLSRLLVACPGAAAGDGLMGDFFSAALIEEQSPVYIVRAGQVPPETVAIAWDGSKEAARAVYGGAPIIANARRVFILHSPRGLDYQDRRTASPDRLSDWLSARGKRAETVEVSEEGDIGEALLDASKGADLIVAGAYGHSRLREFVFGGVTRTLLRAAEGPSLLLAH
ncbi:MAG: universal stress protein [Maricaulaceae bacterium]|nr:universal stress protein [Maricaulaceae bacterium]